MNMDGRELCPVTTLITLTRDLQEMDGSMSTGTFQLNLLFNII